jgi:hypothetical protein
VFRFRFADIRRSTRPFLEDKTEDDFFQIDVRPPTPFHCFSFIAVKLVILLIHWTHWHPWLTNTCFCLVWVCNCNCEGSSLQREANDNCCFQKGVLPYWETHSSQSLFGWFAAADKQGFWCRKFKMISIFLCFLKYTCFSYLFCFFVWFFSACMSIVFIFYYKLK